MIRDLSTLKELMGNNDGGQIAKALTVASGFVGINLEPVARLMLPFVTVLRNSIPVDTPKTGGQQAIWRMQLGYSTFNFGTAMGTAFGGVGAATAGSAVTIQADYKSQAVNGGVQFEAIPMAMQFDDPMQIETARSLASLLRLDELLVLGGNEFALAVPGTITTAPSAVGGSLTSATYYVMVTALTLQGALTNATANSVSGEGLPSAEATAVVVSGPGAGSFTASWPYVPGAVAYKVYVGTVTNTERLVPVASMGYLDGTAISKTIPTYVTVNAVTVKIVPAGGQPVVPVADGTANANVFEGMIAWAGKTTMYSVNVGTKIFVDKAGAKLVNSNSGIVEFDSILQQLWESWNISPTRIICSASGAAHITSQLVAPNGSTLLYRVDMAMDPTAQGKLVGGVFIGGYVNKFAASILPGQSPQIPVIAHPYMPDGTFIFLTERIPYLYSREARGFALNVITPYTYFELGRTDRSFPFSLFMTETLACFHPLAQAVVAGCRVE